MTITSPFQDLQQAVLDYLNEEDFRPGAMPESSRILAVSALIIYNDDTQSWEIDE